MSEICYIKFKFYKVKNLNLKTLNLNMLYNLVSKTWVYNKTCYFYIYIGYIIKLVYFYIYTWDVSWVYKHKDQQVKLFSFSNLHSSIFLPTSPFFGEKCTLPHFLKNKHNSNSHTCCKMGEIKL